MLAYGVAYVDVDVVDVGFVDVSLFDCLYI